MTCPKCNGAGVYLSEPVECRDGKKRRTRLNCDCATAADDPTAVLANFKTELRMTRAVCESLDGQLRSADTFRRKTREVVEELEANVNALRRALELLRTLSDRDLRMTTGQRNQLNAEYIDAMETVHRRFLLCDDYQSPGAGLFDD